MAANTNKDEVVAKQIMKSLRDMQKNLECSVCLELLNNPHSTKCNHQFCWLCISNVIDKSSKKLINQCLCPLCKNPVSRRSLTANPRLADIVNAVSYLQEAVAQDSVEMAIS